ncbi:dimethyladenosine transferase 1, mitochondrial [Dermacentor albipictus]|uniref:dimethyladenosine transferase 1, mitochondrial n=1 Tax=Dermacentor albipictus TaxID=60249 RepID=UPI0031FD79AA
MPAAQSVRMAGAAAACRLPPMPSARDLLRMYGIRAMRKLSQNFLLDPKLARRLVRACGSVRDKHVIEVGPGPGCLTRPLLERGARRVVAIEKDNRFAPTLDILSEASEGRLQVVLGDIFHQHLQEFIPEELGVPWDSDDIPEVCLVGNLPFSVASPLLVSWLRQISLREGPFQRGRVPLSLTFQLEVAERIGAPILDPQRCRLSILCQNYCTTQHRLTLNGSSFVPPAAVDVGLVRLVPLKEPLIRHPFDLIEKVINGLFNGRQKVLTNGVKNLFPRNREELVPRLVTLADVDPTTRILQLTVEEIGRLCDVYEQFCSEEPELRRYHFRLGR